MDYLKLAAALAPLLVAALAQAGIEITEAQVAAWIQIALWGIALLNTVVPSVKAWAKYRAAAD